MAEKNVQTGSGAGEISVLRRKLAATEKTASRPNPRSLLWVLRLALARSAADLCDLPLAVTDARQTICEQTDLAGCLSDDRLLILLDGADGQVGAVSLDSASVSALIQQQTLGKIRENYETTRSYTNTDAAMIAPLINRTLDRALAQSDETEDLHILTGYRFGARVADVRTLILAMSGTQFRVIDLTLDIALGRLHGHICLILPNVPDPAFSVKPIQTNTAKGPTLKDATGVMRAELRAVVCRLTLPLTKLSELKQGDMISLPDRNFNHTELISLDGRQVARGKLGQASGARAVRLHRRKAATLPMEPASEEFEEHTALAQPTVAGDKLANGVDTHPGPDAAHDDTPQDDAQDTTELTELSPHEIAAEITELAGLEPSEALPDPVKE
jgi:flagellar motor switch protein FliM